MKNFSLNYAGVGEMLKEPMMQTLVRGYGESAKRNAEAMSGHVYELTVKTGRKRAKAIIAAGDHAAYFSNLKHNTLLKAIGGSR
jgi:hypothetical protein